MNIEIKEKDMIIGFPMELPKKPRLFEFDTENKIVDIFVRKDPKCPYPFHKDDWYHQGFYLDEFLTFLKLFLHNIGIESIFTSEEL